MDETVVSKFSALYYIKAVCGAVIVSGLTGYTVYLSLSGNLQHPGKTYFFASIFFGCLCIYFYFFSKSWKKVTVTPTHIMVYDIVFKKQLTIPYTDITSIGTYRMTRDSRDGSVFSQNLVIEFSDNRSVTINEAWYENYNRLTMVIYHNKYGPGHGREKYLAGR